VHRAAVAETQLEFTRVGVDIDLPWIECQMQHVAGMAAVVEHIAEAQPDRIAQQAVAHRAAVDEPELHIRLRARRRGQPQPA